MKKIINVIEVINDSISSVESFIIPDNLQEKERVKAAEKLFSEKAIENGASKNDMEDLLDNGYYTQDNYGVFLVWSEVK